MMNNRDLFSLASDKSCSGIVGRVGVTLYRRSANGIAEGAQCTTDQRTYKGRVGCVPYHTDHMHVCERVFHGGETPCGRWSAGERESSGNESAVTGRPGWQERNGGSGFSSRLDRQIISYAGWGQAEAGSRNAETAWWIVPAGFGAAPSRDAAYRAQLRL